MGKSTSLAVAIFLSLGASTFCAAETFDLISRPQPPAGTDLVIRIDHPNPTQPTTSYPTVTFQPGDTVTIHAGGCVQSGGHGNTWHRYVNPSGGDADHLYHGLITIPFATENLARIQKYWNKSVHIADSAPVAKLHLELGFEDEQGAYGDNGYYSHDNGPGDQCAGSDGGPAWVELAIVHHGAVTTQTTNSWDLVLAQFDDNGIPLNPDWQAHVANNQFPNPANCRWPWQGGSAPSCTTGVTNTDFDASYGFSAFNPLSMIRCASCSLCQSFSANYGFGGHANWIATTQTGTVFWEEKSGNDNEYSLNLDTPNAAGADASRPDGIHVEFAYDETIDVLSDDMKIPWWQQFKDAVDGGDNQAHTFLDNDYVIVTGFMGLDFAHNPGPESHPAWAMAVHANTDFGDDTWAFFVRNFGNEGYCSESQHYIAYPDNQYTFRLPWPAGASGGTIKSQFIRTNGAANNQPQISFIPGQAVLLTFSGIPDGLTGRVLIGGELHLSWSGSPTITRRVPGRIPIATPSELGEEVINSAIAKMTPAQRAVYQANLPKVNRPVIPISSLTAQVVGPSAPRPAGNRHAVVHTVRDEALVSQRNAYVEAVKKAYGGTLPTK